MGESFEVEVGQVGLVDGVGHLAGSAGLVVGLPEDVTIGPDEVIVGEPLPYVAFDQPLTHQELPGLGGIYGAPLDGLVLNDGEAI